MFRPCLTAAALAVALAAPASAQDLSESMQIYLDTYVRPWMQDPVIVRAILAQNAEHAALTPAQIDALDQRWRAEAEEGEGRLIAAVRGTAASQFLNDRMAESAGAISEVILMDAVGLNVAATGLPSDYWQGDEAKHQDTYRVGPDAVHIGEIEFDRSSDTFQGQVSATIVGADGQPIGAITLGIDAESLF
ncbi:hypothetical protein EKE94_07105 [Mesobaculum littorinae]|uniref:Uncharacterized protein n=1 Tax=Mesobaculum littorinae TaxID=2486419 RepID=A0A438AIY0_9RHOB|nr:hypothetical protein [Mesobaculum littorinae]RVV98670.1 hypothetical protein EKE94_07105 [Mesobaculum littorinae]